MRRRLDDEQLLTRPEAAQWFKVSVRTIDYWTNPAGLKMPGGAYGRGLPFIKIGHEKRFLLGDLRRFRDRMKTYGGFKPEQEAA